MLLVGTAAVPNAIMTLSIMEGVCRDNLYRKININIMVLVVCTLVTKQNFTAMKNVISIA